MIHRAPPAALMTPDYLAGGCHAHSWEQDDLISFWTKRLGDRYAADTLLPLPSYYSPSPGGTIQKSPALNFLSTLPSLVLPEIFMSVFSCTAVLVFPILWGQGPHLKYLCLFLSTGHRPCSRRCFMRDGSTNKWEQRALRHPVSFPTLFSSCHKKIVLVLFLSCAEKHFDTIYSSLWHSWKPLFPFCNEENEVEKRYRLDESAKPALRPRFSDPCFHAPYRGVQEVYKTECCEDEGQVIYTIFRLRKTSCCFWRLPSRILLRLWGPSSWETLGIVWFNCLPEFQELTWWSRLSEVFVKGKRIRNIISELHSVPDSQSQTTTLPLCFRGPSRMWQQRLIKRTLSWSFS